MDLKLKQILKRELRFLRLNKKNQKLVWEEAPDIKKRVKKIITTLNASWINISNLHFLRSTGAKTNAYARIWGLSKIWQLTLKLDPSYVIEVISEKFDELDNDQKDKVLIHELTHIPQNFSGALVPHIRRGKRNFNNKVQKHLLHYLRGKK